MFFSHRFSTVRLADHIFVIENGTISEIGSHAELFDLQAGVPLILERRGPARTRLRRSGRNRTGMGGACSRPGTLPPFTSDV